FKGLEGITFLSEPSNDFYSNFWLITVLVDNPKVTREDIRLALEEANIESRPLWKPMHLQPVFEGCSFYGDGSAEILFVTGLCLPSGSNLTEADLERVVGRIKQVF